MSTTDNQDEETNDTPSQKHKERNPVDIVAEYERRHTFWSDQALSQLGYSTNLFFTLNIGYLAYIITIRKNYPTFYFDIKADIEWKLVFYLAVLTIVFIALILGASVILSRLYDLRITRFLIWARKRALTIHKKLLPMKYIDLNGKSLIRNFICTAIKIDFIKGNEFDDFSSLQIKFERLRAQQKLLGVYTWDYHKYHILLILLTAILWSIPTIFSW